MLVPEIYIEAPEGHHWSVRLWDEASDAQVAFRLADLRQLWHALGAVLDALEHGQIGASLDTEAQP